MALIRSLEGSVSYYIQNIHLLDTKLTKHNQNMKLHVHIKLLADLCKSFPPSLTDLGEQENPLMELKYLRNISMVLCDYQDDVSTYSCQGSSHSKDKNVLVEGLVIRPVGPRGPTGQLRQHF